VIEVRVRIDDVFNPLVREQPLGFRNHGQPACFTLPALDNHDVVLELDRE
jgi:hypothetical protein